MPDTWWRCEKCGQESPPYTEVCRFCPPPPEAAVAPSTVAHQNPEVPGEEYRPNRIPLRERLLHLGLAAVLFCYAVYCYLHGECHIHSRRWGKWDVYGNGALFFALALGLVGLSSLSVVVDHYDKRDNERYYKDFATVCTGLAFVVAMISLFVSGRK